MVHARRYPRSLITFVILLSTIGLCWFAAPSPTQGRSPADVFDQVWQTINDKFYDPHFNGVDWNAVRDRYKPQVEQAGSTVAAAPAINQMLAELHTSHTRFFTPDEPAYYQVLGIFAPDSPDLQKQLKPFLPQGIKYTDIGILTKPVEDKMFISALIEGSPAAEAGLQVGDQVLSVDGQPFHPIRSFANKAGQPVQIKIQRSPDPQSIKDIAVTPKQFDATTMFWDAQRASVQVIEQAGKKIGYIHVWSCGGDQYQQILTDELLYGRLSDTDGFVLDLREGWGGTPLNALNIYTGRGPRLTSVARDGKRYISDSSWKKPVVMLVNEGSRSAKEILAYGFQRYTIGKVVGTKTAGAVVAGSPFLMKDGSLLYVAVANVFVDDQTRLEAVGVTPDVVVPFPLAYAQGVDPQKQQAIAVVLEAIQQK